MLNFSDPNGAVPISTEGGLLSRKESEESSVPPFWDTYDTINQLYLELGNWYYYSNRDKR